MTTIALTGSGNDDSALFNEAINALKNDPTRGVLKIAGTLHLGGINLTNTHGITIEGEGVGATLILPTGNVNAMLDLTGSWFITLRGFKVGASDQTQYTPRMGLLTAQSAASLGSNWLRFYDVFFDGCYSVSAWYNLGVASSLASGCAFWNYQHQAYTVHFVSGNLAAVASDFASVSQDNDLPMSDWTFVGCEFHAYTPPGTAHDNYAMYLYGAKDIRFIGGNFDGSGSELITANSNGARTNERIIFDGTTFYSENGVAHGYVINNFGPINGLAFNNCSQQYVAGLVSNPGVVSGLTVS